MKEYDYVEVIVEKEKYAKQGARIGTKGKIYDLTKIDGKFEVDFSGIKILLKREEFELIGDYA